MSPALNQRLEHLDTAYMAPAGRADLATIPAQARLVLTDLLTGAQDLAGLSEEVEAGAACAASALPVDAWLPYQRSVEAARAECAQALSVCEACPVRLRCLARALVTGLGRQDITGGLVPREVRRLRRRTTPLLNEITKEAQV